MSAARSGWFLISFLVAAMLLYGCGGSSPSPQVSPKAPDTKSGVDPRAGWLQHEDQNGFSLRYPRGWAVKSDDTGLVTVSIDEKEGRSLVFFRGLVVNVGKTAETILVDAFTPIDAWLQSKANLNIKRTIKSEGTTIIAEFTYDKVVPHVGLLNFTIQGKNAFLSGMSAPISLQKARGADLVNILTSFQLRPDLIPKTAAPAPAPTATGNWEGWPLVTFVDPNEKGFTIQVPKGWKVTGGIFRWWIDPAVFLQMEGEDSRVIVIGIPYPPLFQQVPAVLKQTGIKDGAWVNSMLVYDYMDVPTYIQRIALPQMRKNLPDDDIKLQKITDLTSSLTPNTNPLVVRRSQAEATFTDNKGRTHYCSAITRFMSVIWSVDLIYYRVPAEESASMLKMVNRITRSFAFDADWRRAEQAGQMKRSQIIAATQKEIGDIIDQSYRSRSATMDRLHQDYVNVIRGTTDVYDPTTGQVFSVPSGSNYYWRQGSDIVGTLTGDSPNPGENFIELLEWRPR